MHGGAYDSKCSLVTVPAVVADWRWPQRLEEDAVVADCFDFVGAKPEMSEWPLAHTNQTGLQELNNLGYSLAVTADKHL